MIRNEDVEDAGGREARGEPEGPGELGSCRAHASGNALPLSRFPLVHTRSMEEALSIQSSINASLMHAERLDRRAPFEWHANGFMMGSLGITVGRYRAGVRCFTECLSGGYSLSFSLKGGAQAKQHTQSVCMEPGRTAAVCSPSLPGDVSLQSDYCGIQVVVPTTVVEGTLDALTGVARDTPLRFDVGVNLDHSASLSVWRLVEFMVAEADREGCALQAPLVQAKLEEAFVGSLLLGFSHNYSRLLQRPAQKLEPVHLRRAEEYIAANAHLPITIANLAATAGASAGSLFAAFRAHRGCTPMEFLRARRFELARSRLLASPVTSVAEAALACGFEHLGRFSVGYRKRFGESPRQTLQRARAAPSR